MKSWEKLNYLINTFNALDVLYNVMEIINEEEFNSILDTIYSNELCENLVIKGKEVQK